MREDKSRPNKAEEEEEEEEEDDTKSIETLKHENPHPYGGGISWPILTT